MIRILARPSRFYISKSFGTISQGGGIFGKKAAAEEERFIHDHEVEVLQKYKEQLLKKEPTKEAPVEDSKEQVPSPSFFAQAGSGPLGKREAALEEQYFRKEDQEKLKHLHEQMEQKQKK